MREKELEKLKDYKYGFSTDIENFKNPKLDPKGSEKSLSGPQYSNVDLNKVQKKIFNKKKTKICINALNENLRKKEII